jgi:predicted N-acyltransferase
VSDRITIRSVERIAEIPASAWDLCANREAAPFNPLISHAFLRACEDSGSATAKTGWGPNHLVVEDEGTVIAVLPLYLKSHSYGEYVFDHSWADAYTRAGGRYYPKLQATVPFSPVPGPRLLVREGPERARVQRILLEALIAIAKANRVSSAHITFLPEDEWTLAGSHGFLKRTDQQFHWHNKGYGSFNDFLAELSSNRRKNLRKERERACEPGISFEWLRGRDITERHWDNFYSFYMDTGGRKWGSPYLTRKFFSLIGESMAEHTLLVMAKRAGRYIAGALNFIGGDALFGRNWGAIEHHPFLHFEACYYQAIDFAIAHKLPRVEAGAQGMHKLARGYMPVPTYSAHWIADTSFRKAVERYLQEERRSVSEDMEALAEHGPFRKSEPSCD